MEVFGRFWQVMMLFFCFFDVFCLGKTVVTGFSGALKVFPVDFVCFEHALRG